MKSIQIIITSVCIKNPNSDSPPIVAKDLTIDQLLELTAHSLQLDPSLLKSIKKDTPRLPLSAMYKSHSALQITLEASIPFIPSPLKVSDPMNLERLIILLTRLKEMESNQGNR